MGRSKPGNLEGRRGEGKLFQAEETVCAGVGEVKFLYLESQGEPVTEPGLDGDRRGHVG